MNTPAKSYSWIDSQSSQIKRFSYDAESRVLTVQFQGGSVYEYRDMNQANFDAFSTAKSHGQYLNRIIKPGFPCVKIELPAANPGDDSLMEFYALKMKIMISLLQKVRGMHKRWLLVNEKDNAKLILMEMDEVRTVMDHIQAELNINFSNYNHLREFCEISFREWALQVAHAVITAKVKAS